MDIRIKPSKISGKVPAIGSKSDIHRLLILSALCNSETVIEGFTECADTLATASCLKALGAECEISGREVKVIPFKKRDSQKTLDCGESGSTLRFLLPVAAAVADKAKFVGSGRLPERPIGELMNAMKAGGVDFSADKLPFEISGRLKAGRYTLPGNVSSQYVSGLLMALSVTEGESEIVLTSPLESASYVKMTLASLDIFGGKAYETEFGYKIEGKKHLTSPKRVLADGDWSNAAFFIGSGVINKETTVTGLNESSVQGDKKVIKMLEMTGAEISCENGAVTSQKSELCGARIDLTDTPDLLPILAVVATQATGATEFYGAKRLRLKESDRLQTVADMITSLGGKAEVLPDGLMVYPATLTGGRVDGCNDHRIVMAAAIAAAVCKEETVILGAEAVNKSYPGFFEDYKILGGVAEAV
ncbi:MAG: 3-phosphoshikimate 1-carboxyvinyltransferase [Oscillospiraceae bacterium]|nr:3-phosphoshikimate 1-carboxyvinyltransferase [Oscillospiraceae bacterium]